MRRWVRGLGACAVARPILVLALISAVVRLLLIAVLQLTGDGTLFVDDRGYVAIATTAARGDAADWNPATAWFYRSAATMLVPLTVLYRLFGPSVLVGQLLMAGFGVVLVVVVTSTGLRLLPGTWGFKAGLVVALLPSQVLWSSLVLKDAAVWATAAALGLTVASAVTAPRKRLPWYGIAAIVLLLGLGHLRLHVLVIAAWALAAAAWTGAREGRWVRGVGAFGIACVLPLVSGAGLLGVDLVRPANRDFAQMRAANAQGAVTAFVDASDSAGASGRGLRAELRHLPRGLSAVLLEPYPWQQTANSRLHLAGAEMALWYPLLLFAGLGAWVAVRTGSPLLYAVLVLLGSVGVYALVEGNLGTAIRHRGEFVWAVALLAAKGAAQALAQQQARR